MSANVFITLPNDVSDAFIAFPSASLSPVVPALPDFSDPAKSTMWTVEVVVDFFPLGCVVTFEISIVTIVCDLELVAFNLVAWTVRCPSPRSINAWIDL